MIKQYCEEEKIRGLLVGVDAKKAFDSIDHEYNKSQICNFILLLGGSLSTLSSLLGAK